MKTAVDISILCIAYNQEAYIRRALDGFLAQKGDFTYEILVHDDASTDQTPRILEEYREKYPDKIRLILQKENQYSKGIRAPRLLYREARGKYFAMCEGDDCWIWEGKLREQLAWMEAHPSTALCIHNAWRIDAGTGEKRLQIQGMGTGCVPDEEVILSRHGRVPTASFFGRTELVRQLPEYVHEAPVGDDPVRFHCASKGDIYYMDQAWSVRNYMHEGSWNERMRSDPEAVCRYCGGYAAYLSAFAADTGKRFAGSIAERQRSVLAKYIRTKAESRESCASVERLIGQLSRKYGGELGSFFDELRLGWLPRCADYEENIRRIFGDERRRGANAYVYGAGKTAGEYARRLWEQGLDFDGFAVSDKKGGSGEYMGRRVWGIRELQAERETGYFWLGMNAANKKEALGLLRELGYENILY